VLTAACGVPGGSGAGPAAPRPASNLAWRPCGDGVDCASLTVPVDAGRPDGPMMDLAVARRPAADAAGRVGTLVVNPGGPGAGGVALVKEGVPGADALAAFDIVSWDPRGVDGSRALDCDAPVPRYRSLDWTPDDAAETSALDDGADAIFQACRRAAGDLATRLATPDTVEDLDALRAALGEERLTYLGFSYGTAIGLQYLARHPDRVRAMVLDGVADPREDLATYLGGQARALEVQLPGMLGGSLAAYDRVVTAAEEGRGPLGPTTVAFAAIAASYDADGGRRLGRALAEAEAGDGGALQAMADAYWSQASYGAYAAVVCSDQAHPDGPRAYDALVADIARAAPRVGAVMANELRPCAWWPASAPVPAIGVPGTPPVLVVGNTGDMATPYDTAVRVAADLDRGVLLTYAGRGHTSFGRSACIDEHTRRYLEQLVTPATGTRCT
jgi:pimeloyl-ACP methyl ester carboxylesterase